MIFFHVSDRGITGSSRTLGFLNIKRFISPFVQSCYAGEDAFIGSVIGARYADERIQLFKPELSSIYNILINIFSSFKKSKLILEQY